MRRCASGCAAPSRRRRPPCVTSSERERICQLEREKGSCAEPTGIVDKINEIPNRGNRPLHLYGILDLRVAISTLSGATETDMVLGNFAVSC